MSVRNRESKEWDFGKYGITALGQTRKIKQRWKKASSQRGAKHDQTGTKRRLLETLGNPLVSGALPSRHDILAL